MLNFYQKLAKSLKQNPVVLATVTSTKGSVPREVGAKMLISADGKTYGTIGGGAGEAKVYQQALEILQTGEKKFVEIDLTGTPATQGVCGGTMLVWLELWTESENLNLVNQIIDILTSGRLRGAQCQRRSLAIVTPFNTDAKPYLETTNTSSLPQLKNHALIETLLPPPTLLIMGAGHIGFYLAQVAKIAGFEIIVHDERSDFATPERFPDASLVLTQAINLITEILEKIPNLYVALVTRGYVQDLEALQMLSNLQLQYIGMVGSEKRVRTVYKNLQLNPEFIQQIYAPIGLDIGALTPEEIAVSICAELIKVRRGGTGTSLSAKM
ncbi:XdhC family protein [Nodularia sp. NIES-3585]|uniref:XdhC family protein n=1 Tax=Nodularia sp. NIES-3585 TaxID=1973477 RepID=UPI000B5CE33F|nr:XdhC/CoxI family protein [Nodularia sp. NIES-3585]GAX36777.1 xanthine dehydrogenase accessory factor [Nodularia sp. NIES-3585]